MSRGCKTAGPQSWAQPGIEPGTGDKYRTRAINHRGHYSKKKFWPIGCGYYSREATIQKKNSEQYQANFCLVDILSLVFTAKKLMQLIDFKRKNVQKISQFQI